jgi:hypothetical protein
MTDHREQARSYRGAGFSHKRPLSQELIGLFDVFFMLAPLDSPTFDMQMIPIVLH